MSELVEITKEIQAVVDAARKACCDADTDNYIKLQQAVKALDQAEESKTLVRLTASLRRGAELKWPSDMGQPYVSIYKYDCPIMLKAIVFWQQHHKGE